MKQLWTIFLISCVLVACHSDTEKQSDHPENETTAPIRTADTLSFVLSPENNIIFDAILDGKDTLSLFFDSGGTDLVMTHESIRNRSSLLVGKNPNYEGENYDPLESPSSLSIGSLTWDELTIYPTAVGPAEADGHFGRNLFEDRIVELDYDKNIMIVHTELPAVPEGYSSHPIEYSHTLFCIQGVIRVNGQEFSDRYLFDTGFQRALLLDKTLREQSNFPTDLPVIKESKLRNSAGTEFVNQVVHIDEICFDNSCATRVPTQLLSTPNPARFETHILGNELLKRFNTILDFQNDVVYLRPNSLMGEMYRDEI